MKQRSLPREGGLEAPLRRPPPWRDDAYYDPAALEAEMRRVFDICHGCRRCFNLCDSFPRLFDLIDAAPSGELDSVESAGFARVVDACTLCDMCFMTKCPYVPPHEFDLDFPHLMLRARAVARRNNGTGLADQVTETDRNGWLAGLVAPLANWSTARGNTMMRRLIEAVAGIDRRAALPRYVTRPLIARARRDPPAINADGPARGRKAALFATCFANYNTPAIGEAALKVLAHNGVKTKCVYPECCGMPQLERGDVARVAAKARRVAIELMPLLDEGYDLVSLVPSCTLMMKFEWPLLMPDSASVRKLSRHVMDLSQYVVFLAERYGPAAGLSPIAGGVSLHLACHARAQNMGAKAAEMLRLIPETPISVVERCSGHGGAWGVMKDNFDTALKVGRPAARQAAKAGRARLASECPLAGAHLCQMSEANSDRPPGFTQARHPIELLAEAYGLVAAPNSEGP